MRMLKWLSALAVVVLFSLSGQAFGAESVTGGDLESLVNVQKYSRSIHIMAMLLVGFGFLMVFVKNYGRSAITATFLLVSVAIPLYYLKDSLGILGSSDIDIDRLILAEFAAASLLICAGAVLGRLKMFQYMILGLLFIPSYAVNEWILLEGGLGLVKEGLFVDTGGSIIIHTFGALFGIGAIITMTTQKEFESPIESDATSERFSLLGSMVLWMFWPSFCAALVAPADVPATAINVILALCGSTLATYFASVRLRRKISAADIANAALAGGVAIGAVCDKTNTLNAFIIGILAGAVSTFAFAVIQPKLEAFIKKTDTCGVLNLHGFPGLLGGFAAIFVVDGISPGAQLKGILITVFIALVAGFITGKFISIWGHRVEPYLDSEEFELE